MAMEFFKKSSKQMLIAFVILICFALIPTLSALAIQDCVASENELLADDITCICVICNYMKRTEDGLALCDLIECNWSISFEALCIGVNAVTPTLTNEFYTPINLKNQSNN